MRLHSLSLAGLALLSASAACTQVGTTRSRGHEPALASLPRALTPAEHSVIDAADAFSFALFRTVSAAQRDSNVFLSPLSASFSLGMTLNGAANRTFAEMRSALQFGGTSQQDINAGYKSLLTLLTSLDPAVEMRIANSIWYRRGFPFHQSFLDTTSRDFGAKVAPLDFNDVHASLATINGWVNAETKGKIPTILDDIRADNVMFLINAIYFKGSWRTEFDPAQTTATEFHPSSGTPQPVQLMHRLDEMLYAEGATYQAVDLPYGDSAFTMTVLLPKQGTNAETLAASLTPAFWAGVTGDLDARKIDLYLPKLRLNFERMLNGDLQALGMRVPFEPNAADFTRMSSAGDSLYITFVKQKSFVAIDEQGTEAAAATATGVVGSAAELVPVMRVDRPYLFVIRERLSGTVLFMGKIDRMPSESSPSMAR